MSRMREQFAAASQHLAGGVSASTRVNRAIGHPMYFQRAAGNRLWDLDGREYIDLCTSHGATLLGHGDPRIRGALERTLQGGAPCSYENQAHAQLAEALCRTIPCCEQVRFTGSGTEATMHCIRLARAYTGRPLLLKFEGHFHGYHDQVMFSISGNADSWGDESEPARTPGSSGLIPHIEDQLVVIPFNRPELLQAAFAKYGKQIAAVICEAVHYNAGCIVPAPGYLELLRRVTKEYDALLIFDEVLSAFRMALGGAQQHTGVVPDLCTLGKAVGGGVPFSVFGGRKEIMQRLMPTGDCQHSGTYNGHPLAVAAGLAAINAYSEPGFYDHITAIGDCLLDGLNAQFARHRVPGHVQGLGARFGIYFGVTPPVRHYRQAARHDRQMMLDFIAAAIREGVYFHDYGGAACHHGFCAAMTHDDVDEALARLDRAIGSLGS